MLVSVKATFSPTANVRRVFNQQIQIKAEPTSWTTAKVEGSTRLAHQCTLKPNAVFRLVEPGQGHICKTTSSSTLVAAATGSATAINQTSACSGFLHSLLVAIGPNTL